MYSVKIYTTACISLCKLVGSIRDHDFFLAIANNQINDFSMLHVTKFIMYEKYSLL